MARKTIQGPIRNKEKTKQKLLDTVGKIIREEGYTALKVNYIAKTAGLDKKLIYDYFGNADGLIHTYIKSQDYWNNISTTLDFEITPKSLEIATKEMILQQFEVLKNNKELQKIILWELSEENDVLRQLADAREHNGEELFSKYIDSHFKNSDFNFRAILALLISGSYYLNIHTETNGSKFCGIDLKTDEGRKEIEKAISKLIKWSFEKR
ncbi:MAG: TetR/AcrR family transcriptional regulator [Flavobacteriaceae bacterium]|nr:TetR/AcrR family transcriptional regulator [Flavobacteriaceae bacterium]